MGNTQSPEQRDAELNSAAEEGRADVVEDLIKKGANPNRRSTIKSDRQRTPLHRAAMTKNNTNVLTKLLDHIQDVDKCDEDGNTALHFAAGYYNNASFVTTLLQAQPNCHIRNNLGQTALHSAVNDGNDEKVVEMLLQAGSEPTAPDNDNNTCLHICAKKRGLEPLIPGMLLRFGANPNHKNNEGQTALHIAAREGNENFLLLLKFQANVLLKDSDGKLASDIAATEEIRRILLWEQDKQRKGENGLPNREYSYSSRVIPSGASLSNSMDWKTWEDTGGEGMVKFDDGTEIIIPPPALPCGTSVQVNLRELKQGKKVKNCGVEIDVKLDFPGSLLFAPWTHHRNGLPTSYPLPPTRPPAFTAMCIDGKQKWKTTRDLEFKSNGTVAVHLRLSNTSSQFLKESKKLSNGELYGLNTSHSEDSDSDSSSSVEPAEKLKRQESPELAVADKKKLMARQSITAFLDENIKDALHKGKKDSSSDDDSSSDEEAVSEQDVQTATIQFQYE